MNCLLITKSGQNEAEIIPFLRVNDVDYVLTHDQLFGIEKAHEYTFDVVVVDMLDNGFQIDKTIRILKDCNPHVRIIVRTDYNSRELETLVRKESVFYYHVNSFGNQDFTSALSAALELNKDL